MKLDVITFAEDSTLLEPRLEAHYLANTPLKKYITTEDGNYWTRMLMQGVEGNKVRYASVHDANDKASVALSVIYSHLFFNQKDEDGNEIAGTNFVDMVNTNPSNGQYEPVIEVLSYGCNRKRNHETCPFETLSQDAIDKIRRCVPEYVEGVDEEGDPIAIYQDVKFGVNA